MGCALVKLDIHKLFHEARKETWNLINYVGVGYRWLGPFSSTAGLLEIWLTMWVQVPAFTSRLPEIWSTGYVQAVMVGGLLHPSWSNIYSWNATLYTTTTLGYLRFKGTTLLRCIVANWPLDLRGALLQITWEASCSFPEHPHWTCWPASGSPSQPNCKTVMMTHFQQ